MRQAYLHGSADHDSSCLEVERAVIFLARILECADSLQIMAGDAGCIRFHL